MRPACSPVRAMVLVLLWCCTLKAASTADEPVFPYKAYVNADDVYVRSGPGESYYPTDKLKAGQEVEVYRHDPSGWYAIRPPDGSFTWVSGRHLKPGSDDLAVVSADRVAARVGSRFSDIRDVIQVRLDEAEVVQVLDKVQSQADPEGEVWYKIAPPSGEFRWVFGKYLDPDLPRNGLRSTGSGRPEAARADAVSSDASAAGAVVPASGQSAAAPPAVAAREPARAERQGHEPAGPPETSPEQYQAELEKIDLELSIMVIEEPTVWSFDEIRYRAESLLIQAQTAPERGQARALIDKITRFDDIRRRYNALAVAREETERSNHQLAALRSTDQPADKGADRADEPGGRFDGVGELIRVVSPKTGAPRYALVDSLGQVSCYVTPAPGVYLGHYMGRRVGVTGARGYMPEQAARHVMAQHVSVLEDTRLR